MKAMPVRGKTQLSNRLFTVRGDCSAVMDVHAAVLAALRNGIRVFPAAAANDPSLENSIKNLKMAIRDREENLKAYSSYSERILAEEAIRTIHDRLWAPLGKRSLLYVLVFTAALGSVGFVFALAKPADTEAASAGATPKLGYLERGTDSTASDELWENLSLSNCEIGGQVPVLVLSSGEASTSVQTLKTSDTCIERTFSVIAEAATVVTPNPVEVKINYSPAPTPSSTATSK
jgi:hypothetical protein